MTNQQKILGILMLAATLLDGCSLLNPAKTMDSWLGAHQRDLIASWGPPSDTSDDGDGGRILIYRTVTNLGQAPGQIYRTPYNRTVYYTAPQNQTITETKMFWVRRDGTIYRWAIR